jgi:hypothetical protein
MPVSRRTAEYLAREVVAAFEEAERLMLARIARNLAKGINGSGPHWYEQKLAEMQAYEAQARRLIDDLRKQAETGLHTALTKAYERGGMEAVMEIGVGARSVESVSALAAIERIVAETMLTLDATSTRILRATMDLYRDATSAGSAAGRAAVRAGVEQVLLGAQTRLQATQSVLDRFAAKGIVGFIDKAGRGWNLASYTEMATRAGTMNAAVAGHVDTLQANGLDLVIVSADGSPCELCQSWEGEVLSSSGNDPAYPSLDEATADGLFHPNCLHTVSLYQEGVTRDYPQKTASDRAAEAQRYADNQKLRYIERQIRASKRLEAVAIDDAAKAKAAARVSVYQAKAREHVRTTTAVRQYAREQVGKAH